MLTDFLTNFKPIQFFIVITAIIVLLYHNKKKHSHKILAGIVSVCLINEIVTTFFVISDWDYSLVFNVCNAIHNVLWLLLLYQILGFTWFYKVLSLLYVLGAVVSFFMVLNGYKIANAYMFITGAFLYIIILTGRTIHYLKKENFDVFLSNNTILLYIPVLLFLGFSFILGFWSGPLADTVLIGNLNLYEIIGYFVNLIYYTLIIIYIYREKKLADA